MKCSTHILCAIGCLNVVLLISKASAFPSASRSLDQQRRVSSRHSKSRLQVSDPFAGFRKFWEGENSESESGKDTTDCDDEPAGTTVIASIPVRSIKPGGLRLFLMFYLMGMQNTPERGSWRADQPYSDIYVLEMFFHDKSGMIAIELLENEIRISRCGSVPSTTYLMQESVIVQGVLDELYQCAFDNSIAVENRLLVPEPLDAIDLARESLAFG